MKRRFKSYNVHDYYVGSLEKEDDTDVSFKCFFCKRTVFCRKFKGIEKRIHLCMEHYYNDFLDEQYKYKYGG